MRLADLSLVPWTTELGSDLLSQTELKTAYDKMGRPTHLVAYISNAHFQSMYGPHAWSSVFIAGLWLLFQRTPSGYNIQCRTTGQRYECIFACGAMSIPEVSFFRRGRKIATSAVKGLTLDELEWDDRGIHWLARRCLRFVTRDAGSGVGEWVRDNSHPSVHILPERALPRDFRSSAVVLQ